MSSVAPTPLKIKYILVPVVSGGALWYQNIDLRIAEHGALKFMPYLMDFNLILLRATLSKDSNLMSWTCSYAFVATWLKPIWCLPFKIGPKIYKLFQKLKSERVILVVILWSVSYRLPVWLDTLVIEQTHCKMHQKMKNELLQIIVEIVKRETTKLCFVGLNSRKFSEWYIEKKKP